MTQNVQDNPFPPPGDPNFPNFPNIPNPGNGPFVDVNDPKDAGEALDWVKNGATADKKNKGANFLSRAAVDEGKRKEVAAELEKLTANPNTKDAGMRALAAWAGPEDGPTLLKELDGNNGLWVFDKAGDYVGDALVRLKYAPSAAAFAKHLPDWAGGHGAAARRLAALGAIAEAEVLKYMDSPNNDARDEAARLLLSNIGTKDGREVQPGRGRPEEHRRRLLSTGAASTIAKAPVDESEAEPRWPRQQVAAAGRLHGDVLRQRPPKPARRRPWRAPKRGRPRTTCKPWSMS